MFALIDQHDPKGFLFNLRTFNEIYFLTRSALSPSTDLFYETTTLHECSYYNLSPLVTAVKWSELQINLTNNISVNSVLNQQDIPLYHPQNNFKASILPVLAKIEIFFRINYLCAYATFKIQIKPDYSLESQAELRNSSPPSGVALGKY